MGKSRQSNFELLRIVSMLLIVMHHFALHGSWVLAAGGGGVQNNDFCLLLFQSGGKLGVDLFVMISGYFCINSRFKIRNAMRIVFETLYYSVIALLVFAVFEPSAITGTKLIVSSLLPTISGEYWFVTAYIGMIAFSPFLNNAIYSLGKSGTKKLILLSLLLFSIIPTLTRMNFIMNNLAWFSLLYCIAAYIKLWGVRWSTGKIVRWVVPSIAIVVLSSFSLLMLLHIRKSPLAAMNSIFIVVAALGLFKWFEGLNIGSIGAVNALASSSFAVYLIHDNRLIREVLWPLFLPSYQLPVIAFAAVGILGSIAIYLACIFVDIPRRKLFEPFIFRLIEGSGIAPRLDDYDAWINSINVMGGRI